MHQIVTSATATLFWVPALSFLLMIVAVPAIRRLATHWGCIVMPRKERWHTRPTPTLGGLAFVPAFILPVWYFSTDSTATLPFLVVCGLMFCAGVVDDFWRIKPATKLLAQALAAATALGFGFSLHFLTWMPLDALLTAVWIIGLTNALNLLDNMDGLAGGIGLIAACYLSFLFYRQGDTHHTILSLALVGVLAGFLLYNFHPASIFMGDSGSLFLGAALSLLTADANGEASNILSLVGVPTCILLVPILDTTLVTITRLLRGQPLSQGGKDHASHRLVMLGLSEPHAVLLLYLIGLIAGASAILVEWFSYTLSLALLPLVMITFALLTANLAQVETTRRTQNERGGLMGKISSLVSVLTYKSHLLEVALDFSLIVLAYYVAYGLRFEFNLTDGSLTKFISSLPLVVTLTFAAFFALGVYRGLWRYTDFADLVRIAEAVACSTLLAVGIIGLTPWFAGYSQAVIILYGLLLFLGMAGSRLSFRAFSSLAARGRSKKVPIVIYGAGNGGEVVLRQCRINPRVGYMPIGFVDDDPTKQGRLVLGLPILGGVDQLDEILERKPVQGCIISSLSVIANGHGDQIRSLCQKRGLWLKQLRLEFVEEGLSLW